METRKKCSKCKEVKEIDEFYISNNTKDGHQSICKLCSKKYRVDKKLKKSMKIEKIKIDEITTLKEVNETLKTLLMGYWLKE
jgi:hypothetical protein